MQKILVLLISLFLLGCTQPNPPNVENAISPISSSTIIATDAIQPTLSQTPTIGPTLEEMKAECRRFTLPSDCNDVPAENGGDFCRKCKDLGIAASAIPSEQAIANASPSINAPTQVMWQYIDEWKPNAAPPACPEKIISQVPVDFSKATSILYPGQVRGGNYKPHGGIRFDNSNNNIKVYAPPEGIFFRGSRYLENGELQYLIDIMHPCGIMHRFDHLMELSPKFAKEAQKFRQAVEGDSRTTEIEPLEIEAGELIATKIGKIGNTGMDWGVYDLRQKNDASKNPVWLSQHPGQLTPHALCWLELLPPSDKERAYSLPGGDFYSGKQSDYC
ncbi:MAG: hypothetical protein AABX01_05600 [Candidatus Micrarchaeota archaeon]